MEKLYEGKAKIVYVTEDPQVLLVHFKDDATAFDGAKRGTIGGKGYCNAHISAYAFRYLEREGIPTHFLELAPPNDMLVRRVKILPVEVVMRNIAAGSLSKRLGIEEGVELPFPLLEHSYKNDALHDPLINEEHALILGLASAEQLREVGRLAREINGHLRRFFAAAGLELVDFKLEFGVDSSGRILLADEISPDTCRLWDQKTRDKLDKDRFRRDLGGVEQAYQEVLRRVQDAARG